METPGGLRPRGPFLVYLLWQAPGWLAAALLLWLGVTAGLPLGLAAILLGAWISKDLVVYPAMRAVFRPASMTRPIGARGEAVERLDPAGYVRVNGELWQARTPGAAIEPGRAVLVRSASGLVLIVEAAESVTPSRAPGHPGRSTRSSPDSARP